MKKLLILFLAITSISLNAQEKQNDATWEETVQFLRSNIGKFSLTNYFTNASLKQFSVPYKTNYNIINNDIIKTSSSENWQASLYDLTEAKFKENIGGSIVLYFTKNSVSLSINQGSYGSEVQKHNDFYINFCVTGIVQNKKYSCKKSQWNQNDRTVQRTLKAFKHLAYLANQKRKKSKF